MPTYDEIVASEKRMIAAQNMASYLDIVANANVAAFNIRPYRASKEYKEYTLASMNHAIEQATNARMVARTTLSSHTVLYSAYYN